MATSLPSSEDSGVHRAASAFATAMRRLDRAAEPPIQVAGGNRVVFPAEYSDLSDAPLTEKAAALGQIRAFNAGGMLPKEAQVVMSVSDQDVETMKKKRELFELSKFRKWVIETLNPWRHPERLQWMQQMTPEIFKEMERALEDEAAIKMKYKMIQLRGPHSEEDLWFMYRVANDARLQARITSGVLGEAALPTSAAAQTPVLYSRGKWARVQATEMTGRRMGEPVAPMTFGAATAYERMFEVPQAP